MVELVLRVTFSLAVVLGLFWLAARFASRRFSGGTRSLVRVVGRQALGRSASLAVVEIGGRVLVVGVSESGVRLLTELDPEEIELPETDPAVVGTTVVNKAGLSKAKESVVAGSLLSTQTWRQAWAAATSKTGAP